MECRKLRFHAQWPPTWTAPKRCPMWRPRQSAGAQVQHRRCRWHHGWRRPHTKWGCPCLRCWRHGCWPPTPSTAQAGSCVRHNSIHCQPCHLKRPAPAWWYRPDAARPNCRVPPHRACPESTGSFPQPCPQGSFASASLPPGRIRERTKPPPLTNPCLWSPFDTTPPRLRSQPNRQCHEMESNEEHPGRKNAWSVQSME